MKTGEAIVGLLEQYGVDVVFGIPGTHSIELYRGLSNSSIRHVLPRHEQGGGFMADGYARITGKPGVCFVITGPGVTNILTPMGQAYSDSVPMLVFSPVNDLVGHDEAGSSNEGPFNQGRLHEIRDQSAVSRELTAFSETATDADHLYALITRAFALFESERPRPVHINVPLSLLESEISVQWQRADFVEPEPIEPILVDTIVDMISQAKAPVLLAGGGCRHFGELVISLAEKIPAPVITTVAGRGNIQGSHPLCSGSQLATLGAQDLLGDSDLILVFGSELAQTDHWLDKLCLPDKQVWINLDEEVPFATVGQSLSTCIEGSIAQSGDASESDSDDVLCIKADARAILPMISKSLPAPEQQSSKAAYQRAKQCKERHGEDFTNVQRKHWRVLTELRKHVPHDVVICSDMTQLAYTAIDYLPLQTPNSWFHPNGYGTLGYALPAGIGIKCASPELPVLVIVGDAGLQYTMQEMAVAAELGLNLVVLLWQNDALQQIADDMEGAGIEAIAVQQQNPDFQLLAKGFGWKATRVSGLHEFGNALQIAFAGESPMLLELPQSAV